LLRHLRSLIQGSPSGGRVKARWRNLLRRTARAELLLRGIAAFVLCASLLVACGGGGGDGGGDGSPNGGPTTVKTLIGPTTTTMATTTSTTTP
jgi:hypothetical protein